MKDTPEEEIEKLIIKTEKLRNVLMNTIDGLTSIKNKKELKGYLTAMAENLYGI